MSSCIILYRPKVFNTTLVFLQYTKYIVVHFIFSHVSHVSNSIFRYNAIFSSCYDKNDPCTNSSVKHSAEFMLNLNESFMVGFAGVFKNRTQKQMVREEVTRVHFPPLWKTALRRRTTAQLCERTKRKSQTRQWWKCVSGIYCTMNINHVFYLDV